MRAHFPADFICEGVDQTRGWFYSLLAIADDRLRQPGVPPRHRERAGARCRRPEDVQEPGERGEPLGHDRGVRGRHGAALSPGVESGVAAEAVRPGRDSRGGGQVPQRAAEHLRVLRRSTRDWTRGRALRRRRAAAARPLDPGPARCHRRSGQGGVGRVRPDRRCPRHHGLRGAGPVALVRAAEPVALLGPRRGRRSCGRGHAARGPDHRRAAARPGGAVRRRLAPPRPGGNLGAPRPVSGDARPSAPRPGGRRWTRCAGSPRWRTTPGNRRGSARASRWPGCRWRCPRRRAEPGSTRCWSSSARR